MKQSVYHDAKMKASGASTGCKGYLQPCCHGGYEVVRSEYWQTVQRLVTALRLMTTGIAALVGAGCGFAARAAVVTVEPNLDNTMYSESDNSNALGQLFAGRTGNAGGLRRALMAFDIAGGGIPAGATINSVTLALTVSNNPSGNSTPAVFELHPVSAAWGEGTTNSVPGGQGDPATPGDATWNFRFFNTSSWTTPGGTFGSLSGTATVGNAVGSTYTFASQSGMVADVQSWLNTPASNFGWLLKSASETAGTITARGFFSSEAFSASQRPTLTVDFTPVPEPGTFSLLAVASVAVFTFRRRGRVAT